MKKIIVFAAAVASFFAISSCQKGDLENNGSVGGIRIITAEFENTATKTTLNADGKTPEWAVGDVIRILSSTSYQDVTLAAGNIKKNKITFTTTLEGTLYAVYPASATAMTSCSDGKVTFTIPATQVGTFASANICVAKGDDKDKLVFRNATAVLKIETAADVVGVDIVATENIAGSVTASFSGDEIIITMSSLAGKSVSSLCKSAPSGNVFYLAAVPVTTGSTIATCYKIDKKGSASKDSKELKKNVIYSMNLSSVQIDTDCDLTGTKGVLNGHEYVIIKAKYNGSSDSYLKWATMNIGATTVTGETSYGDLFSWGETEAKSEYSRDTYTKDIQTDISPDSGNDAARKNWGGTWRMPTGNEGEFKALRDATTWTCDSTDKGYYVTKSGESLSEDKSNALLFFPAAGESYGTSRDFVGKRGYYWSSTYYGSKNAYYLYIDIDYKKVDPQSYSYGYVGHTVRPVSD